MIGLKPIMASSTMIGLKLPQGILTSFSPTLLMASSTMIGLKHIYPANASGVPVLF